ncbi:MAG: DUF1287 domain-containing protein [gamma proteobacterium symbiont of Ctena orbiculata]|nr:MAG: DUF1287 domain-containing protein [gamma proteobacterium symbiont of Ctena orbiculata]
MSKLTLAILLIQLSVYCRAGEFEDRLVSAALERTKHSVRYDGSYLTITYPGGDVPNNIGVCTDVLIRSYRALEIDLQQLVHEDMAANFDAYPSRRIWGLTGTDSNIDHRRVPNLQVFFSRHGLSLPPTLRGSDYRSGDIVTDGVSEETGTPLIVHNIGAGPKLEDMLFRYPITGHYRYMPR